MDTVSDEQLVYRYIKNKDEKAFEELVGRYLPLVFGFVKKYTGNQDAASDITQETFVKVWKNIKRFDQSKSFKTWIFTIAKRTAIDELRKKNALPFSVLEKEGLNFSESLPDNSLSVSEQLISGEFSRKLAIVMTNLPWSYSSIIDLHINSGLNFREISEKLKEPLNTVKSRYRRGLNMLKKIVK